MAMLDFLLPTLNITIAFYESGSRHSLNVGAVRAGLHVLEGYLKVGLYWLWEMLFS